MRDSLACSLDGTARFLGIGRLRTRARVPGAGANHPVQSVLLQGVGQPADGAADAEKNKRRFSRQPKRPGQDGETEIEIRMQTRLVAGLVHQRLGDLRFLRSTDPFAIAREFDQPPAPGVSFVEFYTALLLHGLGLDAELFSSVFALARVGGWLGHFREQQENGRLLRPRAAYSGAHRRVWVPLLERTGAPGDVASR